MLMPHANQVEPYWDPQQRTVIDAASDARTVVEAGPGMGKTVVACARIANLIKRGLDPANIWLVSFTRTAVKEIRDRIKWLVDEEYTAAAVKISTVDSQVWHLRQGFDYAELDDLFGSYEANILSIIQMLSDGHEGLQEYLEPMQYLIIDEAQDLVGNRSQLLFELILQLPQSCGITVFSDSAQAIYGFADNDTYKIGSLKDRLLNQEELGFTKASLSTVHRTDSIQLKTIFTDVRDFVLDSSVSGKDKYEAVLDSVKDCAHEIIKELHPDRIINSNSTLILFRRKAEVYLFSQYLSRRNVSHRIRTGAVSPFLPIWIGQVFGSYRKEVMDRKQFNLLWSKKVTLNQTQDGFDSSKAWKTLFSLCGNKRGRINVERLKNLISRHQVPIELSVQEAGHCGPVLSTIHASKGREADDVYIASNGIFSNRSSLIDEETRVLFVAATRARKHLYFFDGPNDKSVKLSKWDSRIINLTGTADSMYLAQVELRPTEDLDYLSFIKTGGTAVGLIKAVYTQIMSAKWYSTIRSAVFIRTGNNFSPYDIYLIVGSGNKVRLGRCSLELNDKLINIIKELVGYAEDIKLPSRIRIMCLGGQTVTTSDYIHEDPASPYGQSGIFIFPIFSNFIEFNIVIPNHRHIEKRNEDDYMEEDGILDVAEQLFGEAADGQ